MVRRLVLAALLALAACGRGEHASEVAVSGPVERHAWLGEWQNRRVVVEPLATPHHLEDASVSEEQMLRERFALDPEQPLLRVHLFGDRAARTEPGVIAIGAQSFSPFSAAELDSPADRLLFDAVIRGLPLEAEDGPAAGRRSLVVHGKTGAMPEPTDAGSWQAAGQEIPLRARTWSERERRAYFETAVAPPEPEEKLDE